MLYAITVMRNCCVVPEISTLSFLAKSPNTAPRTNLKTTPQGGCRLPLGESQFSPQRNSLGACVSTVNVKAASWSSLRPVVQPVRSTQDRVTTTTTAHALLETRTHVQFVTRELEPCAESSDPHHKKVIRNWTYRDALCPCNGCARVPKWSGRRDPRWWTRSGDVRHACNWSYKKCAP